MSLLSHVLKGFFPISSNSLSVDALRFSTQIIVSFANKEYFISYSPILVFLIFFLLFFTALSKTSGTILNRSGNSRL